MFLSILIACRNETQHLIETIRSIRQTVPSDKIEIIVVDDASVPTIDSAALDKAAPGPPPTLLITLPTRRGVADARHIAAQRAHSNWLLLTDSHMIFEPGWLQAFERAAATTPDPTRTLFCGPFLASCTQFEDSIPRHDPVDFWDTHFYYWLRKPAGDVEILTWRSVSRAPPADSNPYEVQCVNGANYFCTRDWFLHVGGLPCFLGWCGISELFLSMKTWLAGGSVRLIPDLRLRHILHKTNLGQNGYGKDTGHEQLLYNKLAAAYQLFPEQLYHQFVGALPCGRNDERLTWALRKLDARRDELDYWRRYVARHLVHDHDWLCAKFDLDHPADLGAVV